MTHDVLTYHGKRVREMLLFIAKQLREKYGEVSNNEIIAIASAMIQTATPSNLKTLVVVVCTSSESSRAG